METRHTGKDFLHKLEKTTKIDLILKTNTSVMVALNRHNVKAYLKKEYISRAYMMYR